MAIYYLDMKMIGGGAGRSAVGAAAYRAGEKLFNEKSGTTHDFTKRRSPTSAAAYHSGDKLNEHDFTQKSGIVYSEIMLPRHASEEYFVRTTLWNAAQNAEPNHNSRTGREIVVALPNELTPEQQIKLVRDYVQRNFVDEGMCADFSIHAGHIHDRPNEVYPFENLTVRKDNPHAHIQLTVRPINKDGTWGAKSKKEYILDKNGNRIKLPSGNWKSRKVDATDWDKTETLIKWRKDWADTVNREFERLGIDERISHLSLKEQGIDREPTTHMGHKAWNLEKKGIKTEVGNKNREIMERNKAMEQVPSPEAVAEKMHELKEAYVIADNKAFEVQQEISEMERRRTAMMIKAENIEEHAEMIKTFSKHLDELKIKRQEIGMFKSKTAIDDEIKAVERRRDHAEQHFKRTYQITPEKALSEIGRLEASITDMEQAQANLQAKLPTLLVDSKSFEAKYHMRRLLAGVSHDREKIQRIFERLEKETRKNLTPKEDLMRRRSERRLEESLEKNLPTILKEIHPEQAKSILANLERGKEFELEKDIELEL